MADDLHEDWWVKDDTVDTKDIHLNDSEDSAVDLKSNKSDDECSVKLEGDILKENPLKRQKQDNDDQVKKKKKKNKKMTITEVLAKTGPCIPEANQLIEVIDTTFKDSLPVIEYEEIAIKGDHFCECNTNDLKIIKYLKSLENAWPIIPPQPIKEKYVKNDKSKTKDKKKTKIIEKEKDLPQGNIIKGSPFVLVITRGAIRATDLIRELKKDNESGVKVAKLFSKHLKLKEITKFLKNTEVHIGVGNPNRIKLLLENGSLSLSRCTHILLDWSWRDVKQYRFIDQQSNKNELMNLLHKFLLVEVKNNNIKFALY